MIDASVTIPSPIIKPTTAFRWRRGGPGGGRSIGIELGISEGMVADAMAAIDSKTVDATALADIAARDGSRRDGRPLPCVPPCSKYSDLTAYSAYSLALIAVCTSIYTSHLG